MVRYVQAHTCIYLQHGRAGSGTQGKTCGRGMSMIRNSVIAEIGYKYKFETFNQTDSYIFHGGAEKAAARKVEKLKTKGIRFTHKIFPEVGHAGLAHGDLKKLVRLIDAAYEQRLKKDF